MFEDDGDLFDWLEGLDSYKVANCWRLIAWMLNKETVPVNYLIRVG